MDLPSRGLANVAAPAASQHAGPSVKRQAHAREPLQLEAVEYDAAYLSVLAPDLRQQATRIAQGAYALYAQIKGSSPKAVLQWPREPTINTVKINGSSHHIAILCTPWCKWLSFIQMSALFDELERYRPHYLVSACMPVVSIVTRKLEPEPSLRIVLCDLDSRKGAKRGDYAERMKPFLTERDSVQIASLADQTDKDNATRLVKLVRSFASETQQSLLGIYTVKTDQQTYELRFTGYKAEIHYGHFLAIVALNEELGKPIILKSLGFRWGVADSERYFSMIVSRNESMCTLHRTHPPVGKRTLINPAQTVRLQVDWKSVAAGMDGQLEEVEEEEDGGAWGE